MPALCFLNLRQQEVKKCSDLRNRRFLKSPYFLYVHDRWRACSNNNSTFISVHNPYTCSRGCERMPGLIRTCLSSIHKHTLMFLCVHTQTWVSPHIHARQDHLISRFNLAFFVAHYLDSQKNLLDRDSWLPCLLFVQNAACMQSHFYEDTHTHTYIYICAHVCMYTCATLNITW